MISPTVLAVPVFALIIGIEAFISRRKNARFYEPKDAWTNIGLGFASLFFEAGFAAVFGLIYVFCYEISPLKMPTNVWWSWAIVLIADDFLFYWLHRVNHESRFFWNFHVVHHSSGLYNLSTAVRQPWFGGTVAWMFYIPLAFLGFPLWMRVAAHGLNLIYQFFIHTRFIGKLGFLEYFLNTPSHHRVHHGVNNEYLDKNYGGIFIIWDRLFGTFAEEKEEVSYGLIKPLNSYNLLWINTHGWAEMWQAMRERKTFFGKLRCMFGSPYMDFEEKLLITKNINKQI